MYTTLPFNNQIDLANWVGQRSGTFVFRHVNGSTGQNLGQLNPVRNTGQLTHDSTRTIKRQLNFTLGVADTAVIDPITSRVDLSMVIAGTEYPLGRYMFADFTKQVSTGGDQSTCALVDEMFIVDQPITSGFGTLGASVTSLVNDMLSELPITFDIESSPYTSTQGWSIGTTRGSILEALAVTGDYFSPWFGNDKKLHMIRSFDPSNEPATFDFDAGNQVIRADITTTSDIINAPNRFTVVGTGSSDPSSVITSSIDIPSTAPHSKENRGFVIASINNLPVIDNDQASAVAVNLARRQTIFERVTLSTAPDPRHDSYDVIVWQGSRWVELAWTMTLTEGAAMNHLLRKVYS